MKSFFLEMTSEEYNKYSHTLSHIPANLWFRRVVVNVQSIPIKTSFYESPNMFANDVPARVFIVFQSTSLFSGDYKESHMTYQRRWPRDPNAEVPRRSRNIEEPTDLPTMAPLPRPMPTMPVMPPPALPPPPPMPLPPHQQQGFIRRNIGNLFGISQRPANRPQASPPPPPSQNRRQELSQNHHREEAAPPPLPNPPEIRRITRNRKGLKKVREDPPKWWLDTDIYLKNVNITFNGGVSQSLERIEGDLRNDPSKYYNFIKVCGSLDQGWSHGINEDEWLICTR